MAPCFSFGVTESDDGEASPPRPEPGAGEAPPLRTRRRRRWRRLGRLGLSLLWWTPLATLLWTTRPYPLDVLAHLTPHAGALLLLAGAIVALRRAWRRAGGEMAIAGAAAIGLGAAFIESSDVEASPSAESAGSTLRIVTFNAGRIDAAGGDRFAAWLKAQRADLVCVIEPSHRLLRKDHPLRERYPHAIVPERGRWWPIVVLSRRALEPAGLARRAEHRFSFLANRCVRIALPEGGSIRFGAMHPASPRSLSSWRANLEACRRDAGVAAALLEADPSPLIVAADMNTTPLGRSHRLFERRSGLRSWGRLFADGTWPAGMPRTLALPIDRIWLSEGARLVEVEVGPDLGSDHRPVRATIVVERAG